MKNGVTVFPDLADSFFTDFTDSGPKATVKICVQAALSGKACPGRPEGEAAEVRAPDSGL